MISVKILLRKAKTKNDTYPIIMRVIKNRKTKTINLGLYSALDEWDEIKSSYNKKHHNYRNKNRILRYNLDKAEKIIDQFAIDGIDFSLKQFEQAFKGVQMNNKTVSEFWKTKIENLLKVDRIGRAKTYKSTYKSFFQFIQNDNLLFKEITPSLLDDYEIFLLENNNTEGGVAVKMKDIRALYNEAIRRKVVDEKQYPFRIYQISKLKGNNVKLALSREAIKKMENLDVRKYPHLVDSKNYLMFSYYSRGMNFHDMVTLTWDNIQENRIFYRRSKTKGLFNVEITKPLKEILDYYRNYGTSTKYIFPILLKENLTPLQIDYRKTKCLKRFNKQLKEIARLVGIQEKVTSYTIRHSFATNLKQAGTSTDIISEALGHSDIQVTQAYLKSFEDEVIDSAVRKLLEEPLARYAS
ncbi:site-specific integrase [Leeuwenhoekiella parthenopeia]|uniref:Site-specific integrase n=1 Tax=Leeuwenhoekiella parthenopeia TaxID=2890320 RepID=A0ABS8GQM1_9FLAO|nr:site-specific integrase [Leeuwenhoekiella parthenopeia]MCC4212255.1 site-specific integrase [Leeuwenhoekiella parthenopeia]